MSSSNLSAAGGLGGPLGSGTMPPPRALPRHPSAAQMPNAIAENLDLLIRRFVPRPEPDSGFYSAMAGTSSMAAGNDSPAPDDDPRLARLRNRCMRILGSRIAAPASHNETVVADLIKKKLATSSSTATRALRFSYLAGQLQRNPKVTRKWAILYFLHAVAQQVEQTDDSAVEIPLSSLSASQLALPFTQSRGITPTSSQAALDSPNVSQTSAAPARGPSRTKSRFDTVTEAESSYAIPEAAIIQDLLFVLQGVDGKLIKWDEKEGYKLVSTDGFSHPVRAITQQVSEVGSLYRGLELRLAPGVAKPQGLVGQSLCAALQAELANYYRLVAVLETAAGQPGAQGLTLRRLLHWSAEPTQRLRLMSAMVTTTWEQRGGLAVTSVHSYLHHGDPVVQAFTTHILRTICQPLFGMVRRWVYEGDLVDPHEEFFIKSDPEIRDDHEHWWKKKYQMRHEMTPSFIDKTLAKKIYLIGKSLNFLRFRARDHEWVAMRSQLGARAVGIEYGDLRLFETSIDAAFRITADRLVSRLLGEFRLKDHFLALKKYLLLGQGDFIQCLLEGLSAHLNKPASTLYRHHLTSVLEQSIRSSNAQYEDPDILRRLDVRLQQHAAGDVGWDVFSVDYHVDAPINTVISPYALVQYQKLSNFLWNLKRAESVLARGWSDHAFATRREATTMRAARKAMAPRGSGAAAAAAHALDRAGGVRGLRSAASTPNMAAHVTGSVVPGGISPRVKRELHLGHVLWSEMTHFVYQLQYYYVFEVVEVGWSELMQEIDKPGIDLDMLIAAHHKYLNRLATRGFVMQAAPTMTTTLGDSSAPPSAAASSSGLFPAAPIPASASGETTLLDRFMRIFNQISVIRRGLGQLHEYAEREADEWRAEQQLRHRKHWSLARGLGGGVEDMPRSARPNARSFKEITDTIARARETFKSLVGEILGELSTHADEHLRNLAVRLNFNEHYQLAQAPVQKLVDMNVYRPASALSSAAPSPNVGGGGGGGAGAGASPNVGLPLPSSSSSGGGMPARSRSMSAAQAILQGHAGSVEMPFAPPTPEVRRMVPRAASERGPA
ncbi:Microtubule-nucleating Tub4p (gamma-tubulin) complex component [Allomyces javanicus]|nr:Microtubule-nucleating Tub4p (gamma-tubulin) complex component [Allomyces javanicus]